MEETAGAAAAPAAPTIFSGDLREEFPGARTASEVVSRDPAGIKYLSPGSSVIWEYYDSPASDRRLLDKFPARG